MAGPHPSCPMCLELLERFAKLASSYNNSLSPSRGAVGITMALNYNHCAKGADRGLIVIALSVG